MSLERPQYWVVDALKVLAAQIIILHHCVSYGQLAIAASLLLPDVSNFLFDYGRYAVQLFLVMAGYLAAQSIETMIAVRHSHSSAFRTRFVIQLAIRRYLRLLGPYVAALFITILCASLARQWSSDDYIGQPETIAQVLAHLFLMQGVLGYESISAGVWYVAIDWQLFTVLAIIYAIFQQPLIRIGLVFSLIVVSLLYFNRHASFEDSFIYFIGSYGLGVFAYWTSNLSQIKASSNQTHAKKLLLVIAFILLVSAFHAVWLRNYLALSTAILLFYMGHWPYTNMRSRLAAGLHWASVRAYCAFLIHFGCILLANTALLAWHVQSPAIGLVLIVLVSVLSWIAAAYLYRWVEQPVGRWRPAVLFS